MTSLQMLPADDPPSVESLLRVRKSQLLGGRAIVRGSRKEAERRSAQDDGQRILDLLSKLPTEQYLEGKLNGTLAEVQYAWLRRAGYTRNRVDTSLAALRDDLQRRVHPPTSTPVTAVAASSSPPAGGGASSVAAAVAPSTVAAVASPRSGRTLADRRGAARNIAGVLAMGLDPSTLWPGQLGLPGRPTAANWPVNRSQNRLVNRPAMADQRPVEHWRDRLASSTPSRAIRNASRPTRGWPR
jgi:hypothetical protein